MTLTPPVPGSTICQLYTPAWNPTHRALDFCAPKGTPILTPLAGVVVSVENTPHGGNNFIIRHDNGLHTYYAHCERILVRVGERVKQFQQVATVGATGSPNPGVTFIDPHLHMQVMAGQSFSSEHYNPAILLDKVGVEIKDRKLYWKPGYPKAQFMSASSGRLVLVVMSVAALAAVLNWWRKRDG